MMGWEIAIVPKLKIRVYAEVRDSYRIAVVEFKIRRCDEVIDDKSIYDKRRCAV